MKSFCKIISIILALVMAFAQLPITAIAYNENVPSFVAEQTDVVSGDGKWKYDVVLDKNEERRAWIKDYLSSDAVGDTFVIPSEIDSMRVQSVELVLTASVSSAIKNSKKIVLEENAQRIAGTFLRAMKNVQIELPSTLLMIDSNVFSNSDIEAINFPKGLCAIGNNAFQRSTFKGDTDIVLPESVKYIGEGAFDNTNITSVKIGSKANFASPRFSQTAGVYSPENEQSYFTPFSDCSSLISLEVDENNPYFKNENGIIYTADEKALVFINSAPSNYAIPESVEIVCSGALENKNFESVTIPSSIKVLGNVSFSGSTVGKVIFAENCTYDCITDTFKNSKIEEITIPKSIKTISVDAFYRCGIKKLSFEDGSALYEIGARAFKSNEIETLDLTNCTLLTTVQTEAFCGNEKLVSVNMTGIPLEELSSEMMCHCYRLKEFKISEHTKTIGAEAFEYDGELEDIDLSNIAKIEYYAFRMCDKINVSDYLVSSGTTEDGYEYNEFANHVSLIGYNGESNNLNMPDTINGKPVTDIVWWGNYVLHDQYINSVTLPANLTHISSRAFENKKVVSVSDFPKTLRFIGENAFSTGRFTSVKLNEGLEYVLSGAFYGCSLKSIEIPDSVLYYQGTVNTTVRSISIGKNVRNVKGILDDANENSKAIKLTISADNPYYCLEKGILFNKEKTEIFSYYTYFNILDLAISYRIPDSVKKIDAEAFLNCKLIRSLTLPSGLEYIGENAFYNCGAISEINITSSVKYIGKNAFRESGVTKVHFEDGFKIETLEGTFAHCKSLKTVTYGKVDIKNLISTYAGSGIKNVDIPESVERLSATYFLTDLSSVDELELPSGLVSISAAFESSGLGITQLTVPEGVEVIGPYSFEGCKKLKTIDFCNVKFLARGAFMGCESLESLDLTGITYFSEDNAGTFSNCPNLRKITYSRTDREHNIESRANESNEVIETVVIGNGVYTVNSKAFADCKNLETAMISNSVESIADDAFENCEKLTIICADNSNAMLYAKRNNINYKTFKILPIPDQLYTGKEIKPALHVTVGESKLEAGRDYSASYTDNINPGTAKAIAAGLGDYSIYAATVKFNIVSSQHVQHTYTAKTVLPTCTEKGYTVYTCTECGYSYADDYKTALGHKPDAAVKEKAVSSTYDKEGSYESVVYCRACKKEISRKRVTVAKLKKTSLAKATVSGIAAKNYTGKAITQSLTVKLGSKTLKNGTDYKVAYKNNKNVGTATVTVTGAKAYSGTITKTFAINPMGTSLSSLTAKSKGFTVKWKKQTTQTTGYEIQYATDSKFTKNKKTLTVSKNSTVSKTASSLKAKKKYYVRIRTYKTVSGKKYYSTWSSAKSVTAKK